MSSLDRRRDKRDQIRIGSKNGKLHREIYKFEG
jgi:hypothetical protein